MDDFNATPPPPRNLWLRAVQTLVLLVALYIAMWLLCIVSIVQLLAVAVKSGTSVYYSGLFARKDAPIQAVADLRGKRMAFGDVNSTSSFVFPLTMLMDAGIDPAKDLKEVRLTGSHASSLAALIVIALTLLPWLALALVVWLIWRWINRRCLAGRAPLVSAAARCRSRRASGSSSPPWSSRIPIISAPLSAMTR